jgi:hypothetical protein
LHRIGAGLKEFEAKWHILADRGECIVSNPLTKSSVLKDHFKGKLLPYFRPNSVYPNWHQSAFAAKIGTNLGKTVANEVG